MVFGLFFCNGHTKYQAGIKKFNDMQPRLTLANHEIQQLVERESKRWSFGWFRDIP